MDLGIRGRKAIVCASSRGLGRACALAPGEGFVQMVDRPLGDPMGGWNTSPREKLLGFRKCPAALYIAGGDDDGTKKATYDLIRRIWHPEGEAAPRVWWV